MKNSTLNQGFEQSTQAANTSDARITQNKQDMRLDQKSSAHKTNTDDEKPKLTYEMKDGLGLGDTVRRRTFQEKQLNTWMDHKNEQATHSKSQSGLIKEYKDKLDQYKAENPLQEKTDAKGHKKHRGQHID